MLIEDLKSLINKTESETIKCHLTPIFMALSQNKEINNFIKNFSLLPEETISVQANNETCSLSMEYEENQKKYNADMEIIIDKDGDACTGASITFYCCNDIFYTIPKHDSGEENGISTQKRKKQDYKSKARQSQYLEREFNPINKDVSITINVDLLNPSIPCSISKIESYYAPKAFHSFPDSTIEERKIQEQNPNIKPTISHQGGIDTIIHTYYFNKNNELASLILSRRYILSSLLDETIYKIIPNSDGSFVCRIENGIANSTENRDVRKHIIKKQTQAHPTTQTSFEDFHKNFTYHCNPKDYPRLISKSKAKAIASQKKKQYQQVHPFFLSENIKYEQPQKPYSAIARRAKREEKRKERDKSVKYHKQHDKDFTPDETKQYFGETTTESTRQLRAKSTQISEDRKQLWKQNAEKYTKKPQTLPQN